MKHTWSKQLNEIKASKDNFVEFIKFAKDALELDFVKIKLLRKRHENMTAACYNPNTKETQVYIKGRAFADVCRSIAHELVHQKQDEEGRLNSPKDGETGSDIENEANAGAGILMRKFGKLVNDLYD